MRVKTNATQDRTTGVIPSMPWRVAEVRPLPGFCIEVLFLDGTKGKVDMSRLVTSERAGVFAALRDQAVFNQVHIEHGAVIWPAGLDLAPDAMYRVIKEHGQWILE